VAAACATRRLMPPRLSRSLSLSRARALSLIVSAAGATRRLTALSLSVSLFLSLSLSLSLSLVVSGVCDYTSDSTPGAFDIDEWMAPVKYTIGTRTE
jgi:hypothetical protein